MNKFENIQKKFDINDDKIIFYGEEIAKLKKIKTNKKGKTVVVTAINPTPYGEGKTTIAIGLVDGLNKIGIKAMGVLREPSLGPVFGKKGGATGGGESILEPIDDINLHFTGDLHAITTTNNLICAVLDNFEFYEKIKIKKRLIKRAIDINDRYLRNIIVNCNSENKYETGFELTVATELMSILCLSKNEEEFKENILNMCVAIDENNQKILVKDLNMINAIMKLMKNALLPNLVTTKEKNPVLIHGGPFANIATGNNSIIATNQALELADIVVTESGFGSDLGYEKFVDIVSRKGDISIDLSVLVVTTRALKYYFNSLEKGFIVLQKHLDNLKNTCGNVIVAINIFNDDKQEEIEQIKEFCLKNDVEAIEANCFEQGSDGMIEISKKINSLLNNQNSKNYVYELADDFLIKIEKVVTKVYGGNGYIIKNELNEIVNEIRNDERLNKFPICIAKGPETLSGKKEIFFDFELEITDIKINYGAQFIVIYTNKILTLPGLGENANVHK